MNYILLKKKYFNTQKQVELFLSPFFLYISFCFYAPFFSIYNEILKKYEFGFFFLLFVFLFFSISSFYSFLYFKNKKKKFLFFKEIKKNRLIKKYINKKNPFQKTFLFTFFYIVFSISFFSSALFFVNSVFLFQNYIYEHRGITKKN